MCILTKLADVYSSYLLPRTHRYSKRAEFSNVIAEYSRRLVALLHKYITCCQKLHDGEWYYQGREQSMREFLR